MYVLHVIQLPSRGFTGLSVQNTLSDHCHSCTFFTDNMNCHDILYIHGPQRMTFTSAIPWHFLWRHHEVNICELIMIADTFHLILYIHVLLRMSCYIRPNTSRPDHLALPLCFERSQRWLGFKVGQCLSNRHMTASTVKHRDGWWHRCLWLWGSGSPQCCPQAAVAY